MKSYLIIACLFSFGIGVVFYGYYFDYVLLNLPSSKNMVTTTATKTLGKKIVTLHFYTNGQFIKEETEILWPESLGASVTYLLQSWLNFLDEEDFTAKKISLQSALISESGNDLYLSFDSNPFEQETSIYQKLMWIESLLKTLSSNDLEFARVYFLAHHQELCDQHLDFSQGWPGIGFLTTTDCQMNQ